jgi:NTP pyrophosphatase (non-canonical NTP hydrolase)
MTTLREAAQQALEALEKVKYGLWEEDSREGRALITALRAALEQPEQPQEATHLRDLLKRIRQWDALDIPDSDGAYWKREIDAALEQPYAEQARRVEQETHGRMRIDPVTGDVSIGTPTKQEQEPAAFDALVAISLLTHLGGEVAEYADVVEAVRRLSALNGELGAALRRLISYCNTLENRLMEADGEHPAMQEAKEAWAKVEGKV